VLKRMSATPPRSRFLRVPISSPMHMQLSASTQYIIDAAELARMKRSALLINTSRGPLINETALLDALRKGVIAGFGVDVYDQEPLPADHPFRGLANVVMTPHIGFVTADNYRTYYGGAVRRHSRLA